MLLGKSVLCPPYLYNFHYGNSFSKRKKKTQPEIIEMKGKED